MSILNWQKFGISNRLRRNWACNREIFGIFAAGKYLAKSGCIGLDRENNREAVKAINRAADNIKNGVCAMGIYPEGYVNKKPSKVHTT